MKGIEVYNDLLRADHRQEVFELAKESLFSVGWDDNPEIHKRHQPCLHSRYNFADLQRLRIWEPILETGKKSQFKKSIKIDKFHSSVLNLTKPADINFIHTHDSLVTCLFYMNLSWNIDWGGETMFYNDKIDDVVYTSVYKPNRLIIFDGKYPHTIKSQNTEGPAYRYTLTMFFHK